MNDSCLLAALFQVFVLLLLSGRMPAPSEAENRLSCARILPPVIRLINISQDAGLRQTGFPSISRQS